VADEVFVGSFGGVAASGLHFDEPRATAVATDQIGVLGATKLVVEIDDRHSG
jgi:hypothetical protein